jgi:hypothetical protein
MHHTTYNIQHAGCSVCRATRSLCRAGHSLRGDTAKAGAPCRLRNELCLQISAEEDADDLALPNTERGMLHGSRGALSGGCDFVMRPDLGACMADDRREPEVDDRTAATEDLPGAVLRALRCGYAQY